MLFRENLENPTQAHTKFPLPSWSKAWQSTWTGLRGVARVLLLVLMPLRNRWETPFRLSPGFSKALL